MGAVDTVLARDTEKLPQPRVPGSERAGEVQRGWKGTGFAGVLPCPTPPGPRDGFCTHLALLAPYSNPVSVCGPPYGTEQKTD